VVPCKGTYRRLTDCLQRLYGAGLQGKENGLEYYRPSFTDALLAGRKYFSLTVLKKAQPGVTMSTSCFCAAFRLTLTSQF